VSRRGNRRLAFWLAVGGVSILAQFTLEVVADRIGPPGLRQFVAYTHKGVGPAAQ
jgi:hypothetical protein